MTNDDDFHLGASPAQPRNTNERLWTPWRMRYVGGNASEPGCIFCNRLLGDDDVRSLILYRGELAFVIMNLFPYNTGHIMIVPNTHVGTPEQADDSTLASIGQLLRPALNALRRALDCDGFNVGFNVGAIAGAGVADHLHQHVVPRWSGDANFMPILASTMVLPELIPVTYAKLRTELAREFTATGPVTESTVDLVIINEAETKVALSIAEGRVSLPWVTVRVDQSASHAVAQFLTAQHIDAVMAGWAGSNRATVEQRSALTYVTTEPVNSGNQLRFVDLDEARTILTGDRDRALLRQAIHNLAPGIR